MPLEVVEIKDLRDFTKSFVTDVIVADSSGATFNDTSTGWDLGIGDGTARGGDHLYGVYDHIRDRYYFHCQLTKRDGASATALRPSTYCRDALCRNSSIGWWRDQIDVYSGTQLRLKVGNPNLQTGVQKIYCYNTAQNNHYEINPLTGDPLGGADLWPNVSGDFLTGPQATGNDGYWLAASGGNPGQALFMPVIFEGITSTVGWEPDGASNEGILWANGNSHPKGLALMTVEAVNFGGGSNLARRWIWVDLDTGEAAGVLGVPVVANSSNTNPFAEPTIDGRNFVWTHAQFVPDTDSTPSTPKGELHFSTTLDTAANEINGVTVEAPTQTFSSVVTRQYVAVYDFNPFNAGTGTVRQHNRRIFLGILDQPQEPIIDGGADSDGTDDGVNNRSTNVTYHPPSRTYFTVVGRPDAFESTNSDNPVAGHSRIIRWRRAVVVDRISQPTPTTAVTENRTIRSRVVCHTDLGERAVGVAVSFVLSRLSTRAESFDGTATGAGTYTVEADEIDEDQTLDVRSGNDVDNGGTLLAETTDYTVNYATGVLTPVGSWPSATIYVRYRHRNVKLTPGHGTLLSPSTVTDGNGNAFALIQYEGDQEGEIDSLAATV